MLRTLHYFLARELAKVTLMALVAFTLVMTVFAIIEPLRKQGLSSDQVISFLGYTLPMMVSLTLPVAALFAATIAYGRLAQDNEVLACRAGGIATLTLLEPALVLGVLVTACSLWLSNSVTPYLAQKAEEAVRGNIRGIVQYQLRKQGYVRSEGYIVHADAVDSTEDGLVLRGVVTANTKPPKDPNAIVSTDPNRPNLWDVTVVSAEGAAATFQEVGGEAYVSLYPDHPVVCRTAQFSIAYEDSHPIDSMQLPNTVRDDPGWYTWEKLLATMKNPAQNVAIQQSIMKLWADLGHEMLVAEVVATIKAGKPYTKLKGSAGRVEIAAPHAEQHPLEAEMLCQRDPAGARKQPVVVRLTGTRDVRTFRADRCRLTVSKNPLRRASLVALELDGDVEVVVEALGGTSRPRPAAAGTPATAPEDWTQRETSHIGELEVPADVEQAMLRIDPNMVLANIPSLSTDRIVLQRARYISNVEIPKLRGAILAQIHGRLAYGLSCFLMVAMGAALGLLYRGGQLLSAFVISIVPAAIVIIMIVMGKQMLGNPRVLPAYGLAAVWGGIVALALGDLCLYAYLARK